MIIETKKSFCGMCGAERLTVRVVVGYRGETETSRIPVLTQVCVCCVFGAVEAYHRIAGTLFRPPAQSTNNVIREAVAVVGGSSGP